MSITASEMTPADIAAVTHGGGNSGSGLGYGGDGAWWLIVLFLFAFAGRGWGNNDGGNGGGTMTTPYVINNDVQRGFDQQSIMNGINSLTSDVCNGFSNVQQSLCSGFAGVNQNVSNGFAQAEIAENGRQMANMNQMFNLQSQFADCCCENRLGLANLNATILSENCADREALSNGVRDIITNQTANTQAILDKMCQQELDAERRENADLRSRINMLDLAQSQTAQTAQILADNARQTTALEQYLNPVPVPAYVVQNPNCCQQNTGCGCGGF